MNDLRLERIDIEAFEDIYKNMQEQFPENELKPLDIFKQLLTDDILKCYAAVDQNCAVGYVVYAELKNGSKWLDYIAIKKEFQSKGYGRKILALFENCFLEVEKPDVDNPDTLRRIKFYKSLGAEKLNINYIYPNNTGGLPMDLYYLGGAALDRSGILNAISEIFAGLHSDVQNIDKIFNKISIV